MGSTKTESRPGFRDSPHSQRPCAVPVRVHSSASSDHVVSDTPLSPRSPEVLLSQLESFANTMAEIAKQQRHIRSDVERLQNDLVRLSEIQHNFSGLTSPLASQHGILINVDHSSWLERSKSLVRMHEIMIASEYNQQERCVQFSKDLADYLKSLCPDEQDDPGTSRTGVGSQGRAPCDAERMRCFTAFRKYNEKAAEARNRYDHLCDLDVEYEDKRFPRAWQIETGMALACSDEEFEASYRQERTKAQDRYDEAREAAEQAWAACKDVGIDPGRKKHLPIQRVVISSSPGSLQSRAQSPEDMIRLLNPSDRRDLFQMQLRECEEGRLGTEEHVRDWMEKQMEEHMVRSVDLPTYNVRDETPAWAPDADEDDLRGDEPGRSTAPETAVISSGPATEMDAAEVVIPGPQTSRAQCPTCSAWMFLPIADMSEEESQVSPRRAHTQ